MNKEIEKREAMKATIKGLLLGIVITLMAFENHKEEVSSAPEFRKYKKRKSSKDASLPKRKYTKRKV